MKFPVKNMRSPTKKMKSPAKKMKFLAKKTTAPMPPNNIETDANARVPCKIDNLRAYARKMDKDRCLRLELDDQVFGHSRLLFVQQQNKSLLSIQ